MFVKYILPSECNICKFCMKMWPKRYNNFVKSKIYKDRLDDLREKLKVSEQVYWALSLRELKR